MVNKVTVIILGIITSGNEQNPVSCKNFLYFSFALSVYYSLGIENYGTYLTAKAKEKPNDLWCYNCDTMEQGAICGNLSTNHSSLIKKCQEEELMCMVQRFSYTYSTENMTSGLKMWSLQRKCSKTCEPSCIVIGERVKLFACTSCCNASLCNTGNGSASFEPIGFMESVAKIISVLFFSRLVYF